MIIKKAPIPKIAIIPLSQDTGTLAKPIVRPNSYVKVGTKIGEPQDNLSTAIYSSISGVVKSIEPRVHPMGGNCLSVVIESDGKDEEVRPQSELLTPITDNEPVIERVVAVKGDVKKPKTLLVRIGTPFKELIEFCGGYISEPQKIIMNNPITGIAQFTDTVPVIKTTKEIWVQNIADLPLDKHCIRCGFCVEACSIGLLPKMIVDYMMSGKMEKAKELGLMDCIECANCAFVCPAKRNLIHWIMYGKAKLYASGGNRTHITSSGG